MAAEGERDPEAQRVEVAQEEGDTVPVEVRHSVTEAVPLLDPLGLAEEHTDVEKERVPVPQTD